MSQVFELKAQVREQIGKGAARKIRTSGGLPAILYQKNSNSMSLNTCPKTLQKILHSPLRHNAAIALNIKDSAGKEQTKHIMVKDVQVHLVRRTLTHADFVEIDMKKPVQVNVPIKTFGKSKSVVAGGKFELVRRFVKVESLPDLIPAEIKVDITNLPFGSTFNKDITLPENVKLADNPDYAIITIKQPRTDKNAEESEETASA